MDELKSSDIERKTTESLIWNTVLPTLFQVLRFAVSIVIARLLNPKDFGIIGVANIFIFYVNSVSNFGFSTALIQKKEIHQKDIDTIFTLNLSISVLFAGIILFFADWISKFFAIAELKDVLMALSSILIITAFYTIPVTLLRRNVSFKAVSTIEIVRGVIQSGTAVTLAMLGYNYWALVYSMILSNIVATIIIGLKVRWIPKIYFDTMVIKKLGQFSLWNFFNAQMRLLSDNIDKLIIGKFLGPVQLGFYEKGFAISYMPLESIGARISGVMFSVFSRYQGDPDRLKSQIEKTVSIIGFILFPVFLGLFSITPHFVEVLLGEKWMPMCTPMRILLLSMLVSSITNVVNALNIGAGYFKPQIKFRAICLFIMFIACLKFVSQGIVVIALIFLIYQMIFFYGSCRIALPKIGVQFGALLMVILPHFAGALIMGAVITFMSYTLYVEKTLFNTALLVFYGALIYSIWTYIVQLRNEKGKDLLKSLKRKWKLS